jgi:hypothetical protein
MTVSQIDQLQKIGQRINAASLAVRALGTDADHQCVEERLADIFDDLRALAGEVGA